MTRCLTCIWTLLPTGLKSNASTLEVWWMFCHWLAFHTIPDRKSLQPACAKASCPAVLQSQDSRPVVAAFSLHYSVVLFHCV